MSAKGARKGPNWDPGSKLAIVQISDADETERLEPALGKYKTKQIKQEQIE